MLAPKSIFIMAFMSATFFVGLHGLYMIATSGKPIEWLLGTVGPLAFAVFFSGMMIRGFLLKNMKTNKTVHLWILHIITAAGFVGSVVWWYFSALSVIPIIYGSTFFTLGLLYDFWYSKFNGRDSDLLKIGKNLPEFQVESEAGVPMSSSSFKGKKALILFYRGNWCPLCMAQIKKVAKQYNELRERGVELYLISPQPHENTQSLAERFDVPMHFLVDPDNRAAKAIGILDKNGLPMGLQVMGYDSDTVMPTVVMTDELGTIIFADLTDNYRVRPEPETFLAVLDRQSAT